MAKRQFQLTEEKINQLRQAEQETRDALELKRLQAVRLYGSGVPTSEIIEVVNCTGRSVRRWSQRYMDQG